MYFLIFQVRLVKIRVKESPTGLDNWPNSMDQNQKEGYCENTKKKQQLHFLPLMIGKALHEQYLEGIWPRRCWKYVFFPLQNKYQGWVLARGFGIVKKFVSVKVPHHRKTGLNIIYIQHGLTFKKCHKHILSLPYTLKFKQLYLFLIFFYKIIPYHFPEIFKRKFYFQMKQNYCKNICFVSITQTFPIYRGEGNVTR